MPKHEKLKATCHAFLLNPEGEVDGLLLDGQRQLKFPPHQAKEFLERAKPGQAIEVEASPGDKSEHGHEFHFHKWSGDQNFLTVEGKIEHLLVDKEGEVRGYIVQDGSQVHVPKHLRKELKLAKGMEFKAEGQGHKTPHGTVIKAELVHTKSSSLK